MGKNRKCHNCGAKLGIFFTTYRRKSFCGFDCKAKYKEALKQSERACY
jgi:hypothetical protein